MAKHHPNATAHAVEVARLGARAYAAKKKLDAKQWKHLVTLAHQRGFSVNDFLDTATPDALKPRTKSYLTDQANKTVNSAYAPAESELNTRESQIKAIDAKRAQDNQYYLNWLASRTGELQTHAAAADQAMLSAAQSLQQGTVNAIQQLGAQAQAKANEMNPGNVSGRQTDQNLAAGIAQEGTRDVQKINAATQITQQYAGTAAQHRADMSATNFAQMAAAEAQRTGDTWKALSDVAGEKLKLKLSKAADIAQEVQDALDKEVSKAQNNRDFAAVAGKLNLQEGQLALDQTKEAHANARAKERNAIAGENAETQAQTAEETARHNQAMESLRQQSNDISQGKLDVQWYNARHKPKGGGSGSGGGGGSNDPQERFDNAYATLSSRRTARATDSKNRPVPYDVNYVRGHINEVINDLVHGLKLTREMAARVVQAYLDNNGSGADPGSYKSYAHSAAGGHDRKPRG